MGTKEGPSIPRSPTFHLCLGQSRASRDPGSPKTHIGPVSTEGTQSHHLGLLALDTTTHKMKGCP